MQYNQYHYLNALHFSYAEHPLFGLFPAARILILTFTRRHGAADR